MVLINTPNRFPVVGRGSEGFLSLTKHRKVYAICIGNHPIISYGILYYL